MYTINTAISEFLRHCKFEKNLSSKTIKSYSIDLKQLTDFLINKCYAIEVSEITKTELREFLESISTLKPKSIKRKIATIKAMFNFLEFEDKVISNPLRKMRIKIKESKQLPKVMDLREVRKIFKLVYEENSKAITKSAFRFFETLRNIVIVELLFATGARVSEIASLRSSNIEMNSGTITIIGKGSKERIIQVCNMETLKVIKDYHKLYLNKNNIPGDYFLINRLGGRISDQSIRIIVKKLASKAKVQKHITPHVFRHTFATLLLEKDVDIKYIQALLGHSSIMTTQIYTHVNHAKQKKILSTKHPRKDFSMIEPLAS